MRIKSGGRIDRKRPISFKFNNRPYSGFHGDTLASALLASNIRLVARSWKYHRPRGVIASGVEEPNALVQLFDGDRTIPNAKMTEVELVEGLVAYSVNVKPSVEFDYGAMNGWISRFLPAGFYYKTFMASQGVWHFFEKYLRQISGLGRSPSLPDPDYYDKQFVHCDILIVGGGIAGLNAALTAGSSGARVILCDEQAELGGWLLSSAEVIDGMSASSWIEKILHKLENFPEVKILTRTTAFGFHDHRYLTLSEKRADYLPLQDQPKIRERLWKVRAKEVVIATGAHERPLVFSNNDLPGIMLASAVSTYLRRYGVLLGQQVIIFTNNDNAYDAALAYKEMGAVVRVIDARPILDGDLPKKAEQSGILINSGAVIIEARGTRHLEKVMMQSIDSNGQLTGAIESISCDLLAISGGFSPVIHLQSQAGSKAKWSDDISAFITANSLQGEFSAGACAGVSGLLNCAISGKDAGKKAAIAAGFNQIEEYSPLIAPVIFGPIRPLWLVPHTQSVSRAPKQFVDFQNDVAASDLYLAVREGFESIEHVKRYTAMGFGTDQGKTGNINGMGIVAEALGKSIPEVGTTTFRPNYTPVTFGLLAGVELGDAFEPIRTTPIHTWHEEYGAEFEDVGQWKRPWYYPKNGEDMHSAVQREVLAARNGVAILDASTLGKIDIQGPDAVNFLNLIYTNNWTNLEIGKCRYGLMLDENGMVFDDGVTAKLDEDHFLMHTTTGGAARVLAWMERWLQTEWPHLKVFLTSVTDHWSTTAIVGPHSRSVLQSLCSDINFDDDAFPFMSCRSSEVAGLQARIMRISFTGERSYEVSVSSSDGLKLWNSIYESGKSFGITPYGTEAMHILRAEKGYIIVGQDTDGSTTPIDLGMGGLLSKNKDFLGKRSLARSDTTRPDRKQFVGLLTSDRLIVIPEGSQIICGDPQKIPTSMQGHVTSSYFSPTLNRSISLALVNGGLSRLGEKLFISIGTNKWVEAEIVSPNFYDQLSERQNA
jgi:sarcosine oxidase subunit alpha